MLTNQAGQRLSAATVVAGLLLVAGCRSASVNSLPAPYPGSAGGPAFYRSYEKPGRAYDDLNSDQYQSPQPDPPSVLPAPGSSDPSIPPTPSAKKSRWNLNNAGVKFPSLVRPNSDVRQTGNNSERIVHKVNAKSEPSVPKKEPVVVEEEVVQSRLAPRVNPPKLSSKAVPFPSSPPSSSEASTGEMPLLLPPGH